MHLYYGLDCTSLGTIGNALYESSGGFYIDLRTPTIKITV